MNDKEAFAIAVEEAKISYGEGGVPVSKHKQTHPREKESLLSVRIPGWSSPGFQRRQTARPWP